MNLRRQVYKLLDAGTTSPVYGNVAPPSASSPYVVFRVISDISNYVHAGFDNTGEARVQVSCFSTASYQSAAELAEKIITALNAAPGSYGVKIAQKAGERDLYEEDTKTHHVPIDFMLAHITYSSST